MLHHNGSTFLEKSGGDMSFIISMFAAISRAGADREVIIEDGQFRVRKREQSEITTLERDTSSLEEKIFAWIDAKAFPLPLVLNNAESELLAHCAHAAYYFIIEDEKTVNSPAHQNYIKFYNQHFKRE